jgi:predicted nucleotidyltransferase component of viral defense system
MTTSFYNNLQIREIFHIEFLRAFSRKFKPSFYALKGGVNLRLFFKSARYSEDMDLDVNTVDTVTLRDFVMKTLTSDAFVNELRSFGIEDILPPNIIKAKQTTTTQRFKIHLISQRSEDLFTKVEFSRRGSSGNSIVESISDSVLRPYKISPLLVSHYDIHTAVIQKINALAGRKVVQARDVFDLYLLSTQYTAPGKGNIITNSKVLKTASENIFSIGFNQFRDTVLSYLTEEDRRAYDSSDAWDEIKLKVNELICPKPIQ